MTYMTKSPKIVSAMNTLATGAQTKKVCSVRKVGKTHPGNTDVHLLEIKPTGAAANRPVALITGGVHAREVAPPAAVFSFGQKLIQAYAAGTDVDYPALTDGAITYPKWSIPKDMVKKVVDALTIQLIPVVNPDGRDFVIGPPRNADWRGNRNLAACAAGVDLNRNFNIGWAVEKYYSASDEATIISEGRTNNACDPARQDFRGTAAGDEKETANVQKAIDDANVRYYVDVHSQGAAAATEEFPVRPARRRSTEESARRQPENQPQRSDVTA